MSSKLMRDLIDLLIEDQQQWEPVLRDAQAIAEYISTYASDDVDEELIEEHYHGCHAKLETLPIASLREGDPNVNIRSSKKEKKYMQMDLATMPPIVVENGKVVDGNHRLRVAKAKGETEILCYVIYDDYT